MSTGHTPGPWHYITAQVEGPFWTVLQGRHPIADLPQDNEANARLITESPELFDLLQIIAERLPRWRTGDVRSGPRGLDSDFSELLARVESAIARVTGCI